MIDVLREVGMINRALDSIANAEFKDLGLANRQFIYLVRIYEHPGIIAEQLADLVKVDKTTLARAVRRLINQDYVRRESDPDNKKIRHLFISDKGKQAYQILIRENRYSNQMSLQGFSDEEIQTLHDYLVRMRKNVDANWQFIKHGGKRQY